GLYDLRATATDNAGNSTTSSAVTNVRVDNTAPATSSNAPAQPPSADGTATPTGVDAGSGIDHTEYKVDGGSFHTGTSVTISARAEAAATGRRSAPTPARRGRSTGTRRRSATARTTSAQSSPTTPATRATRRCRRRWSTTPRRPRRSRTRPRARP